MNYIVFDLEFNQSTQPKEQKSPLHHVCPFEIIQIGAVRLNAQFEIEDTFNSFIKPVLYPTMHPFVESMTGITQAMIDKAKTFSEVMEQFLTFIGEESIFCVWGGSDMKELFRNIAYHQFPMTSFPKKFINVQQYTSKLLQSPGGGNIGLRTAVEILNITISGAFHDALYDACYTAEIFKKIYSDAMDVQTYEFKPTPPPTREPKRVLDEQALFTQFEKMFSKNLTDEERAMIRLAYFMGKSRQFQIEVKKESQ
ncbi:MAG: exonuclease domain-containing protein, partial [Bacillaceae bacterium]